MCRPSGGGHLIGVPSVQGRAPSSRAAPRKGKSEHHFKKATVESTPSISHQETTTPGFLPQYPGSDLAPPPRTLMDILGASAADHPDAPALDDGERSLTYAELLSRSAR